MCKQQSVTMPYKHSKELNIPEEKEEEENRGILWIEIVFESIH